MSNVNATSCLLLRHVERNFINIHNTSLSARRWRQSKHGCRRRTRAEFVCCCHCYNSKETQKAATGATVLGAAVDLQASSFWWIWGTAEGPTSEWLQSPPELLPHEQWWLPADPHPRQPVNHVPGHTLQTGDLSWRASCCDLEISGNSYVFQL